MRRIVVVGLIALLALGATDRAVACDPYWDWCGYEWYDPYWDLPAYEEPSSTWWDEPAYEPAPAYAWSDPFVWTAPGSDIVEAWVAPEAQPAPTPVASAPDPAAAAAALGLHTVTEVWTGHTTTTAGPVTTYASTSAALDAGTRAKVVATVGTGESSPYDAGVLGGRTTLTDGRVVAGVIYENYVWNGYEWVVNGHVFFQDDSELARLTPIPTQQPIAATVAPVTTAPPSAPAFVTPLTGDIPVVPVTASPPAGTSKPVPRVVKAGIALAPQADPLGRVEVLRGRAVPLYVRATIDDVPARVLAWQLVSGEVIALGPIAGIGEEPLLATWRSVTTPGSAYSVRLRASVEVPGEAVRETDAYIEVAVRAPALVE